MATGNLCILLFAAMLAAQLISAQNNDAQGSSSHWWGSKNRSRNGVREQQIHILTPQGSCDYNNEPDWACFNSTFRQFCSKNNLKYIFNCTIDRPFCDYGLCCRNSNCLTSEEKL